MKYLKTIIIILMSISSTYTQNINWSSSHEDQRSLTYLNFGYDFGVVTQVGYGQNLNVLKPIIWTVDYSFPAGKNLVDDFKVRLGGQVLLCNKNNFMISAKAYGVFRRHQTKLVRMANLGFDMAAIIGYYKPKWHIATEIGFDKSILTHLKHSDIMRENASFIKDGWFSPSGGYYFYGIQGSKTIGNNCEISLRVGATNAQFKDENALLPAYAQLGLIHTL